MHTLSIPSFWSHYTSLSSPTPLKPCGYLSRRRSLRLTCRSPCVAPRTWPSHLRRRSGGYKDTKQSLRDPLHLRLYISHHPWNFWFRAFAILQEWFSLTLWLDSTTELQFCFPFWSSVCFSGCRRAHNTLSMPLTSLCYLIPIDLFLYWFLIVQWCFLNQDMNKIASNRLPNPQNRLYFLILILSDFICFPIEFLLFCDVF